jgi:hypothetical protein
MSKKRNMIIAMLEAMASEKLNRTLYLTAEN